VSIIRKAGMQKQSLLPVQDLVGGELENMIKFELLKRTD